MPLGCECAQEGSKSAQHSQRSQRSQHYSSSEQSKLSTSLVQVQDKKSSMANWCLSCIFDRVIGLALDAGGAPASRKTYCTDTHMSSCQRAGGVLENGDSENQTLVDVASPKVEIESV